MVERRKQYFVKRFSFPPPREIWPIRNDLIRRNRYGSAPLLAPFKHANAFIGRYTSDLLPNRLVIFNTTRLLINLSDQISTSPRTYRNEIRLFYFFFYLVL